MTKAGLYLSDRGYLLIAATGEHALYSNYEASIVDTEPRPDHGSIFISERDLGIALKALYMELTNKD